MIRLLFKYLKRFWLSILIVLGLLYFQTRADLKLPELMSQIVNVGITRSGIEDAAIEVIRENQFDKLLLFVSNDEQDILKNSYVKIEVGNASFPIELQAFVEDGIYLLDENAERDHVAAIIAKPLLMTYAIDQGQIEPTMFELPPNVTIYQALSNMDQTMRESFLAIMNQRFASMRDDMLAQSVSVAVLAEYQAIGLDTDRMQMDAIVKIGMDMLMFALLSALITILVGLLSARMAAKVTRNIRRDVFSKVESFSNVEFDQFSTASLITRSGNDITQLQMLIVMMFRTFFYSPILAYGAIMNVMNANADMTWIIGLALVIILGLILGMFVIVLPKFTQIQKMIDKVNLVARESLTGLMVVRAFKTERHEEKRFDEANIDLSKVNLFVTRAMAILMPIMNFIFSGVTLMIVWYGAKQIDIGALQVGDMMAFMQYSMQIIMAFMMIVITFIMIPRASVSSKRINEVLDMPLTILDPKEPQSFDPNQTGVIEFKEVCFSYPNADDSVLKNINFIAKKGEITAIIGSTGSGKSTLINLIPRFYDVTQGSLLVNGVDVRNVRQGDLRDRIGYVPQKAVLFTGTIESNLRYAKVDANPTDLDKAIDIAQARSIVEEKPDRYQETISQGGSNVSGGQKQRLSIARALIKNPDIYIYDDSFSALDYKTDVLLRQALQREYSDKTLIIVAQRISTILHAAKILVLNNGEIVGRGTHDELMQNCDVYQEIAFSQMSKEELAHV